MTATTNPQLVCRMSQSLLSWMSPRAIQLAQANPAIVAVSIPVVVDEPSGAWWELSWNAGGRSSQSLLSWMSPRAIDHPAIMPHCTDGLNPCCRG